MSLHFMLDEEQEREIRTMIFSIVKDAVKQVGTAETKPVLNRKEIAQFLGVAPTTIDNYRRAGMPVIEVDRQKLYSKKAVVAWLETKTTTAEHK